ncbi:MAG: hypothetical protein ACTHMS_23605 [Jatrophihabitans sp.]|uniref:hypothetical protein n=1 Tax=Jatrophihabitans sp. TaxID=1932789 RepID=UPI003F7DAA2F
MVSETFTGDTAFKGGAFLPPARSTPEERALARRYVARTAARLSDQPARDARTVLEALGLLDEPATA